MRIIIMALLLSALGCKKDKIAGQDQKTPVQLLIQKEWILTGYGFDDNDNGMLDAEENLIQDCQKDNTYRFHPSGTGNVSDNATHCNSPVNNDFSWKFLNNHAQLEMEQEKFNVLLLNETALVSNPDILVNFLLTYRH